MQKQGRITGKESLPLSLKEFLENEIAKDSTLQANLELLFKDSSGKTVDKVHVYGSGQCAAILAGVIELGSHVKVVKHPSLAY